MPTLDERLNQLFARLEYRLAEIAERAVLEVGRDYRWYSKRGMDWIDFAKQRDEATKEFRRRMRWPHVRLLERLHGSVA